ncbi:MAG TPA: methylamine utilization protein [Rhodanobacteraceae bacterium]
MSAFLSVLLMLFAASASAAAGELRVTIDDGHGHPASDAVVSLRKEGDTQRAQQAPMTKIIDQRDETFIPYVEVFRPGDQVVFRNSDRTRHHVYSFAAAKSFEFVIAPGDSSAPVTLDRAGEIAVGCNIHDKMITHLLVSDAPWIARSPSDGRVVFEDLPAGTYEIDVWHPQLRPGKPGPHQTIVIDDGPARATFSLSLLPDPRQSGDRSRY